MPKLPYLLAVPPGTTGFTTHVCTACGNSYKDSFTPAKSHTPNTLSTCLQDQICIDCGQLLANCTGHAYAITVTSATCTEQGYTTHTCTRCHDSYKDSFVAAKGHTASHEPTCIQDQICTHCGQVLGGKTGHVYTETVIQATCLRDGYTIYSCQNCEYSYVDQDSSADHTPSGWIIIREPTDLLSGEKYIKCLVCQEVLETESIPVGDDSYLNQEENTQDAFSDKFENSTTDGSATEECQPKDNLWNERLPEEGDEDDIYTLPPPSTGSGHQNTNLNRNRGCGSAWTGGTLGLLLLVSVAAFGIAKKRKNRPRY